MTSTMQEMDELRLAVGEIEALAAILMDFYDRSDWSGFDQLLVERVGYMIGVLATSATTAAGKFERFQIAFVDAQPVPVAEQWDYDKGTSPGDDEPDQSSPGAGDEQALSAEDAAIIQRIRELCPDNRYEGGSDAELLDLFRRNKRVLARSDEDVSPR